MRHPFAVILLAAAILDPAFPWPMRWVYPSARPAQETSRAGGDILKKTFEYAALNPMEIVATLGEDPLSARGLLATKELGEGISGADGVSGVESVYTVGEAAARDYAGRVETARKQAQAEAAGKVNRLVEQQIEEQTQEKTEEAVNLQLSEIEATYGVIPLGSEEQIRTEVEPRVAQEVGASEGRIREEVERRVAEEVDQKVPDLPEGISADGDVTPEGVANFLKLVRPELQGSTEYLNSYVANDKTLLRG